MKKLHFMLMLLPLYAACDYDVFGRDYVVPTMHSIPAMPAAITFAGEAMPLQYFDVRESMERELAVNAHWHSQTLLFLRLANRYFPVIEPLLKEHGVPDDFKYLCVAESGLQHVVSPAKAAGLWQITPATAKELLLEVNDEVDERYNIELSTIAACSFLRRAYDIYGSWTMAAAAYNMGYSALAEQVLTQKSSNYYDLRLNIETSRYVYRIAAIKEIMENPAKYGFAAAKDELYPPLRYSVVSVSTAIVSLADFAAARGTNYKMLKLLNPWLRKPFLTNKNSKTYYIKILDNDFRQNAYQ
jgi:hypothetical protein